MANKQCKQDPWTQHTPWPYDPWQYQRWVCMLMLFDISDNQEPVTHMCSSVAHLIAYNPYSWPTYWYFFLAVADIDKDKYVADSRFYTGWKVAKNLNEKHKVSVCSGIVARPQRVPRSEQEGDLHWVRPGGFRCHWCWGVCLQFISSSKFRNLKEVKMLKYCTETRRIYMLYDFKVTESKPAVRAMSPERRGCLLKKETQTSLYEVTLQSRK